MAKVLISVIVPVYNVENYLNRCIESIVNQTYKNLEIILVDDGSTDNSAVICDAWAQKDARIRVVHKDNEGAAVARNVGLNLSQGELIGFVDSDDYIELNMYSKLYESMRYYNSDIVIAASTVVSVDGFQKKNVYINVDSPCKTSREILSYLYCDEHTHHVIWNKLYKHYIWENIKFPNLRKLEDEAVLPYIYDRAEKISIVNETLYHYCLLSNGIMGEGFSKKDLEYVFILEKQYKYFKNKHYDEICKLLFLEYIHTLLRYYVISYYKLEHCAEILKMLRQKFLRVCLKAFGITFVMRYKRLLLSCIVFFISPILFLKFAPFLGINVEK